MTKRLTFRDYELLSAYMDGALSPGERRRVEKQLETRAEFRKALSELQQTRKAMRSMPHIRVPRNFFITPAMVQPRRAPFLVGALRFSSALAALAAVILTLFQLVPGLRMAPASRTAPDTEAAAALMAAPADGESAPPIIQWGAPEGKGGYSAPIEAVGVGGGAAEPTGLLERQVGGEPEATPVVGILEMPAEITPELLPTETPFPTATPLPEPTPISTLETLALDQAQPILGVAPSEEQGSVLGNQPQMVAADLPTNTITRAPLLLRSANVLLGALAVLFFLAAWLIRKRLR